jgi:hypothetical protein
LKGVLQDLKDKGKLLFIITNDHYDYLNLTMTESFGPNWIQLFDLVICNAKKPLFTRGAKPFFQLDEEYIDFRGPKIFDHELVANCKHKLLTEGNAMTVTKFIQKQRETL